jgi:hypothetical protein
MNATWRSIANRLALLETTTTVEREGRGGLRGPSAATLRGCSAVGVRTT